MRISDWSSDVCSSDLARQRSNQRAQGFAAVPLQSFGDKGNGFRPIDLDQRAALAHHRPRRAITGVQALMRITVAIGQDRKSVVQGTRVSVRVDLGGRRIIKKKNNIKRYDDIYN